MDTTTRNLLVLKILSPGFRARDLDTKEIVSVKTRAYKVAILDTVVFLESKRWQFNQTTYISGEVQSNAFSLDSLEIEGHDYDEGETHSTTEYYEGSELKGLLGACLKGGKRPSIEFHDYTGYGFYGRDSDPVFEAADSIDPSRRYDILTKLWEEFPQCIDALAHIANPYVSSKFFYRNAENCYRAAIAIAEKNLPPDFDGITLWSCLENRPYLRALQGYCILLWRLGRFAEAEELACKVLRRNPPDNQGVRFIIDEIHNKEPWTED
jgi:tetratricopeptide (TPR) repeat protein